jgi:hypothetical protein
MKLCFLFAIVTLHASGARVPESADGYQERFVVGTVIGVNPELALVTIRGPDLLGRLRIRFKSYKVKQPFVLYGLEPGDRITAVFSSRDNMLHRLRRIQKFPALVSGAGH